jgi:hypothetical protein
MSTAGRRMPASGTIALIGGLTVIGLAFRLPSFNDSLWGDELATNFVVNGFGVGDPLWIVRHGKEATPPLFFLLTWLTKGFDGVDGVRLVSLVAGLLTIPLTYALGVRTVGTRAAVVGAALVALSPAQIFYSTEARAYALMMLFCLLACICLLIALESGRFRWWVAYGASVSAAMYTHYTSLFVLIGLFGWAFVARPDARKQLMLATAGAALLFVPWLPELVSDSGKRAARNIELVHPLTLPRAKTDLLQLFAGHPFLRIARVPGDVALWLIGSAVALGAAGLAFALRARDGQWWRPSSGVALVLVLALAAPVGAAIHNVFAPSVFLPRNLLASWPGFALALGALVTAGPASMPLLRWAAAGLLVGGFTIGAFKMLETSNQRPEFDAAAAFIEKSGDPGSPVVELPQLTPGPQTSLEAALAPKGAPLPRGRSILELGFPTFAQRIELNREGKPLSEAPPPPSDEQVARQAAGIAGTGKLFLVAGPATPEWLRAVPAPVANFLAALPPRFHQVESRTFPGLAPIGVYVLSGQPQP